MSNIMILSHKRYKNNKFNPSCVINRGFETWRRSYEIWLRSTRVPVTSEKLAASLVSVLVILVLALTAPVSNMPCAAQVPPLALTKALQATELPEGAWGAYSRTHAGPCYLADRFPQQLYAFPIVVGQSRIETVREMRIQPDGKKRLSASNMVLRRRSMGMAPVHAEADDVASPDASTTGNRRARVLESDADGYLWKQTIAFRAAKPIQSIMSLPDENGVPQRPAEWGEGEAAITCFPAFVDPGADGLLIRIAIINSSSALQTWFVDLLGGIDTGTGNFVPGDLTVDPTPDTVTLKHKETNQAFCLGARGEAPAHSAAVNAEYFSGSACASPADARGQSDIEGLIHKDDIQRAPKAGRWGIVRLDGISIAAGEQRVVWMCVGVGKDADSAGASVRTLLSVAEDSTATAKVQRTGAYTQAIAAHGRSQFSTGNADMDRLMAQSLLNVPCTISRRLGVASRSVPGEATYRPELGGYIGLGWIKYRQDWSASQFNAWFATLSDPGARLNLAHARRSADLFAVWQLYQETGSTNLLKYIYPFARHRYQELVAGCRIAPESWLFGWPGEQPDGTAAQPADPVAEPECSARIAASAQILSHIAAIIARPESEIQGYDDDRAHTLEALNRDLWRDHAFAPKSASSLKAGGAPGRTDQLISMLPLIAGAGAFAGDQLALLLKRLKDPGEFWSEYGLRSVSRSSNAYKPAEPEQGGVEYGDNWLIWQGLIDLGETDAARELAANLINGYIRAATATGGLPQYLNGDTGAGCGAMDWSGDAGCIEWLYSAYHAAGTVTSGHQVAILDHHYDAAADSTRIVFKPRSDKARVVLLCVMRKPMTEYAVEGDAKRTVKSDSNGVVTLEIPAIAGTQQLTIAPAASVAK